MPLYSMEQTYTKELYSEYAWCAYRKLRSPKKLLIAVIAVVLAIAALMYTSGRIISPVILVLSTPVYPIAMKMAMKKNIDKAWDSTVSAHNLKYHIDFYETYLEMTTENGNSKVDYEKLYGILESDNIMALMLGNNQGNVLDKSRMSDELIAFIKTKAKLI